MNVFAIGVEEPHFTLSTRPCASAAFMSAGAVSGVKSRMIPPPWPAAWYELLDDRVRVRDGQRDREALARDARRLRRP